MLTCEQGSSDTIGISAPSRPKILSRLRRTYASESIEVINCQGVNRSGWRCEIHTPTVAQYWNAEELTK